ncbi:MAG: hypothetical protein JWP81_546 [Ferruginibacter sp.]|nr:hypothetical protein [Ferruginibacter sp.]
MARKNSTVPQPVESSPEVVKEFRRLLKADYRLQDGFSNPRNRPETCSGFSATHGTARNLQRVFSNPRNRPETCSGFSASHGTVLKLAAGFQQPAEPPRNLQRAFSSSHQLPPALAGEIKKRFVFGFSRTI